MKKFLSIILAVLMLVAALAGCGENKTPAGPGTDTPGTDTSGTDTPGTDTPGTDTPGTDTPTTPEKQANGIFRTYNAANIPVVCSFFDQTNAGTAESLISVNMYTRQVTEDRVRFELGCELAESLPQQMDAEGKVWRVTMKKGLKWSNGEDLTIDDLIYTFKMLLDPKLKCLGAPVITNSSYMKIVNAKEYNAGTATWDEVGIKKIDDYTIELTASVPTFQVSVTMIFFNFSLVNDTIFEKCFNEDRTANVYGTSVDKQLSCGPFMLTSWTQDGLMKFERNPNYVRADEVNLAGYQIHLGISQATALELFLKNELDYVALSYTNWEQFEDDPRVNEIWGDSLMYLMVNVGNPDNNALLGNISFRNALYYGIDRTSLAKSLGVYPASRMVRRAVIGNNNTNVSFQDIPAPYADDPTAIYKPADAIKYLTQAYEACGITSPITHNIIISETALLVRAAAEVVQKQYLDTFGGQYTVNIQLMPSSQATTARRWNPSNPTGYELAFGSLLPSSTDPRGGFSYYYSTYSPPRFCYSNPTYDALYDASLAMDLYRDADTIVSLCQKMEEMLLKERLVVPCYENPSKVLISEKCHLAVDKYITGIGFYLPFMSMD